MLWRALALVQRSLRVETRDVRIHLFRCCLPALFLITISTHFSSYEWRTAIGRDLFAWLIGYNYFFISAAAATFFATAITEEREAETLGLLRMAGVGSLTLVLGKWFPRLLSTGLLLLVQLPFTYLCITLGGILWPQILAAFASLAAHLVFVGGLALVCSVCSRTSSTACLWTALWLALIHLAGLLSGIGLPGGTGGAAWWNALLLAITQFLGATRLIEVMQSGFVGSAWCYQVASNLLAGSILLLAGCVLFGRLPLDEPADSGKIRSWLPKLSRLSSARRTWGSAPLFWHAFYLLTGGPVPLVLRFAGHVAVSLVFNVFLISWNSRFRWDEFGAVLIIWGLIATALEGAYVSAQVFRCEIAGQTWGTLCLLPKHVWEIAWPRWLGAALGILPGSLCLSAGILLNLHRFWGDLTDSSLWLIPLLIFSILLWSWQLTTLYSITIDWSAWPVSILLAGMTVFTLHVCLISCIVSIGEGDAIAWAWVLLMLLLSAVTHGLVHLKLTQKAADG
jgi:hypothetical protein